MEGEAGLEDQEPGLYQGCQPLLPHPARSISDENVGRWGGGTSTHLFLGFLGVEDGQEEFTVSIP